MAYLFVIFKIILIEKTRHLMHQRIAILFYTKLKHLKSIMNKQKTSTKDIFRLLIIAIMKYKSKSFKKETKKNTTITKVMKHKMK